METFSPTKPMKSELEQIIRGGFALNIDFKFEKQPDGTMLVTAIESGNGTKQGRSFTLSRLQVKNCGNFMSQAALMMREDLIESAT